MRVTAEKKAATRQRILEVAGALFRQHGVDGVGVDAIMHAAGLTHGGFYTHFSSKEALAAEVAAGSLGRSAARWERIADTDNPEEALRKIVDAYLDSAHVSGTRQSCVLPALGADVARRDNARPGLTAELRRLLETLRTLMGNDRQKAIAALSCMVGAVLLARISEDAALSGEILTAARMAITPV